MGIVTVTEAQARFAHQDHYAGPFEIVHVRRSGPWDFPPLSFVYGISDYGGWDGLVSTDGTKVVVSRSTYMDAAKPKRFFVIERVDIEGVTIGTFKTTLALGARVPGLTKGTILRSLLFMPGIAFYGVPALIALFMPAKLFQFRIATDFGKRDAFAAALKGCVR